MIYSAKASYSAVVHKHLGGGEIPELISMTPSNQETVNPAFLVDNKFHLAATHEECVKNVVALAKSIPKQPDHKTQEWEKWFRNMDQGIKEVMFVGGRAKELGCFGWIEESLVKAYKEAVLLYYREQGQPVVVKPSTHENQKPQDNLFTPTPEKVLRKPTHRSDSESDDDNTNPNNASFRCGFSHPHDKVSPDGEKPVRRQGDRIWTGSRRCARCQKSGEGVCIGTGCHLCQACARKHLRCSHTKHLVNPTPPSPVKKQQVLDEDDSSDTVEDSCQEDELDDTPPRTSQPQWKPLSLQSKSRPRPSDSSRSSSPNTRSKKRMVHETSMVISSDSGVDEPKGSALKWLSPPQKKKRGPKKTGNSTSSSNRDIKASEFHDKFSRLRKANADAHKLTMQMLANALEISEALIEAQMETTKGGTGSQASRRK
ncbi:hypothetical protein EYR38_007593 [Pleurotus pulmonarius]|nr:hypothetical protein EYR38_007593 [Pleurotus pulmonarius]